MSSSMIEFILLAGIALFIGWRLYVTLGQDDGPPEGRQRGETRQTTERTDAPAPRGAERTNNVAKMRPNFAGPAADGLEAIYEVDNAFRPRDFLQGARAAYEMIVSAFARGDRDALRPLLDDDVYDAWNQVITEREANGQEGMQLLRIRDAEITDASLDSEGMARVTVEFSSELGDGEHVARANELWTFMRQTSSTDPNWLLDDVDTVD